MSALVRFSCPRCNVGLKSKEEKAGVLTHCPRCREDLVVPHPVVGHARPIARKRKKTVPVGLSLTNGAAVNAEVSQETANTMAKTFLGGLLVAIGVVLAAWFGGKGKSA